jgi:transcriptional regulator with XRE-family HTH domain
MSRIRVSEVARRWMQDPAFRAEYDALEEEFALASAIVGARARAGLTQEQLARRMKTTQTVIARLESGRARPSTRTLQRFARATGHRLVIGFEPAPAKRGRKPPPVHPTSGQRSKRLG